MALPPSCDWTADYFSVWQEHLHLRKTQLPLSQSFLFSVGRCLLPSAGQHWHVTHLLTLFLCSDLLFSFSLYLFHLVQFNRQNINIITILIHLIPEPSCTGSIRHSLYQFHFIPLFLLLPSSLLNKQTNNTKQEGKMKKKGSFPCFSHRSRG